ncbi:MAG TPA: ComEA family DNA-binding protein [Candidatus Sumerlaeota bacterium]|jgi:competence protein ComEA|nr:MAG: ComE operon protein 1 [candidate division BRC1 bacterium ADurb.Bin183]HOE63539.1 ComEA family DNA-binding protein [Candidatus Sumerlaeota bacterium]HRR30556.1 ComEA family DNA-binding protein [Candidatus Sumerlaeia bacterium]HON51345.1 ComEA family DNA-binding protein [Candidatus Sumerlaeota bacterium]HOR64601.1 ComEA family DNA-binding protein [Candidatus Sumerlaeota bacterium]
MSSGLTRQEQRVLFILIFAIAIGLGIQQCKQRMQASVDVIRINEQSASASNSASVSTSPSHETPTARPLININTASNKDLCLLKGIGPAKASAIIEFREQHGPFRTIDDLDNVSGIGPATIERIRKQITVGDIKPSATPSANAATQTQSLAVFPTPAVERAPAPSPKKININTAGLKELMTLPGVGEKRAQSIIEYRQRNGGFKSIEEIMNIKGVSIRNFESIKDKITITKQ